MGRFVGGQDRRQSRLLPRSPDDDVTENNSVRMIRLFGAAQLDEAMRA